MNLGKTGSLTEDTAQEIAIGALTFLGSEPEQLGRFLSLAGIGPQEIRDAAAEPGFLAGVLEFLMQDEQLLLAYTESVGVRPTMIAAAHLKLAGGVDFLAQH
ncbi:DUF3572 domain-containing protein [Pseudovibrio ascidiaceicola]|jgi:hypothetical protein|uniref:DUF3572 domain-containing protein n=1 Tax=Pseudovibrio ascidiaceicola TaxID=285279 RepID=A0A1I4EW75_9HYPH|nr:MULTISPECIES: DUF3572 domain-containing protein [Pseudovibrio]KZK79594.1 hypothetical protein PsAD46_04306 [Pseudovibrio sp. Ad46]KZL00615.1 hypothetical protein PsW74_02215 [Pseudovibrio sp. W74]KZL06805.1 hypothetical protein PsAD14_04264 [Pseudovibrio sp. Ad14]KZL15245.1 hypothetical protein PsAD37_04365 [Pseudovibrio sp. Ad37]KZL23945.1 hypothetical protein PsWM33_02900 [Pseudovibrio sp. WM33]